MKCAAGPGTFKVSTPRSHGGSARVSLLGLNAEFFTRSSDPAAIGSGAVVEIARRADEIKSALSALIMWKDSSRRRHG